MIKPLGIRLRLATEEDLDAITALASYKSIYDGTLNRTKATELARRLIYENDAHAFIMNDSVTEDDDGFPAIFQGYVQDLRFETKAVMNPKGPYFRDQLFESFPLRLIDFISLCDERLKREFPNITGIAIGIKRSSGEDLSAIYLKLGYRLLRLEDSKEHVWFKNL